LPLPLTAKLWGSAAIAAAAAWAVKLAAPRDPILGAALILGAYGSLYFAITYAFRVEECAAVFRRLARFRR
jgi:putative peptidoglycan lipid II flippase